MQRTLQRADADGNGGINIGQGRRRHARRERGSVQLMIGVQGQRDVENMLHHLIGLFAGERIQKIGREAQFRIAFNDGLAVAQAVETW